jgi:hypothetical protein
MKSTVKYGVEPVYLKNRVNKSRILSGYIVSKCFLLNDDDKKIVLFPYTVSEKTFTLHTMRTPNRAVIGYKTEYVDEVYDTFDEARIAANKKNKELNICINDNEYKYLKYLQGQITDNTKTLKINQKNYVYNKKGI